VLLGDSMRLTQILINLAGNAIKFTKNCKNKKGMVFVNAKVTKDEEEIILVEFSVKDNGIGIPADKLEHVFERFRQADSATTRKYGGTGLGLSIAKQLVELQKGQMTVKSKFKMGSVFTFCIPFKKSSLTQLIPEVTKMEYNIEDLRKLKILMVEDNPLNILLMTNLFSENNLKMEVAKNGVEGIERLKENNIDIILMDMEMPVMNGYEATGIIRNKMKNNVPIIAMTANAMAGERDKCLRLGMNDYISKPIDSKLLFNTMYNLTIKT
jgi:CheY-like chemotaxis protein